MFVPQGEGLGADLTCLSQGAPPPHTVRGALWEQKGTEMPEVGTRVVIRTRKVFHQERQVVWLHRSVR